MDLLVVLKGLLALFLGVIALLIAVVIFKNSSFFKALIAVVIEMAVVAGLFWAFSWGIDVSMKKAVLYNVKNSRILSQEKIYVSGDVRNVGKYTINNAYIEIKLINAAAGGKISMRGEGDSGPKRDSSISESFKIATNIKPGTQKHFSVSFRYPAYFRLSNIRWKLSYD